MRLAQLGLDLTARFNAVEESWRAMDWSQMSESERTATVNEFEKRLFSFNDLEDATNVNPTSEIVIDGLEDLSRGSETELTTIGAELNELDDSSTGESDTESTAGGINTKEARLDNANALSNKPCNDFPASSSIDSGYRSNPGSQQVHGTASASPSAAFLPTPRPSHQNGEPDSTAGIEDSGDGACSSTGQKRPHVGDNASAKRPRLAAELNMEDSTSAEFTLADPELTVGTSDWPSLGQGEQSFAAGSGMAHMNEDFLSQIPGIEDFDFDFLSFLGNSPSQQGQLQDGTGCHPAESETEPPAVQEKN